MKNSQETEKAVEIGNQTQVIDKNLSFDGYKRIALYVLLSKGAKGGFSAIAVGLLTTVLGMIPIPGTDNANADELPDSLNLEPTDKVTQETQTKSVRSSSSKDEGLSGVTLRRSPQEKLDAALVHQYHSDAIAPSTAKKAIALPSITANLETTQPIAETAPEQQKHTPIDSTSDSESQPPLTPSVPGASFTNKLRNFFHLESKSTAQNITNTNSLETRDNPQKTSNTQTNNLTPNLPIPDTGTVSQNNAPPVNSEGSLAQGEVRILTPKTGVITLRSTNLVVQYNPGSQIQVSVNQKPLDPSTTTQQQRDEAKNTLTQVWYNIPLKKGKNTITVQAGNGTPASIELRVEETAARKIEITPEGNPRVPADGRSIMTLKGRITDENGQLITEDVVVTLTSTSGKFVGADRDKDRPGFQVLATAGQFTAQLQSTVEAQKVRIRAATDLTLENSQKLPAPRRSVSEDVGPVEGRNIDGSTPLSNSQSTNPQSTLSQNALPSTEIQSTNQQPTPSGNPGRITVQPSSLESSTLIEAYTQVEFITNLRPSLVSGSVSLRIGPGGTNFWGSRRDFLNPDTIDDGTEFNLTGAVFATGKVGEWLFTGAYNSERPLNETCDGITRLFRGSQFCEQQYPVYGDSSTVDYLTPSTDSVYLRFERSSPVPGAEPDYVMWGDYSTQEFARSSQLFTATTRQLHGFKGNYNLGNLQFTALYSRDVQAFQRDTIQPNGTSGYYFLSRRLLVPGSENVFLETEENNRPGTVIDRKPLTRGADYEIDYDRGTLMFRRPILATEFDPFNTLGSEVADGSTLLVHRIVVTYQHENAEGDDAKIYAGRLQYNFSQAFNLESWIAASYLREDQGAQDFELFGADFRVPLGEDGQIIGEYAHSRNFGSFRGGSSGSAYRIEANGTIVPNLIGRAYWRSLEEGFTNNATTSFTPGQTRYGAALSYKLGSSTNLQVGYDHEVNFGISPGRLTDFYDPFNPGTSLVDPGDEATAGARVDNSLTTIRAGIQQKIGAATLGVDYVNRSRDDRVSDVFTGDASQIVSRLSYPFTDSLTFRAQNELNLGSSDPLYPNRTTFGLDWKAYPGVTVRLAHQFFDGGLLNSNSITSLDTILEHQLGENTTLRGRYSVISAFNGVTGQGAVGLNHRWIVAPGLRVNLGYEHTFSNTSIVTAAGDRFAQPYAVGQSASALGLFGGDVASVGIEYTDNPNFKASARIEHRFGSGNNNTVLSAAAAGKLSPALTALARFEQANFSNQLIEGLGNSSTLRVGLAYRDPNSDRWNALLRYEHRVNPYTIPEDSELDDGTLSNEHVFAMETIFAPSWRWEFYGKGALRYSSTSTAVDDYSATTFLSQLRASYRLGYRMDLAVEGRWIGQSKPDGLSSYNEFGVAVETGYYLTPDLRLAVGYSFGSVDDRDFTGYRSKGGPYFSLIFKVNELFGGFGRQRVVPPQQQESQVKPVANQEKPAEPGAVNPRNPGDL